MRTTATVLCVLICVAVMGVTPDVRAQTLPAVEITSSYSTYPAAFSLGWRFIPTRPFRVTALGVLDIAADGVQNIANGGQDVSLFEWGGDDPLGGPCLVATTVPTTDDMLPVPDPEPAGEVGAYYIDITPITLYPGTEYMIAARVAATRDYAYTVTFLNEEVKPFTRTNGQATAVGYPEMPTLANDTGSGYGSGTFPIGPTAPLSYYGGTFKYELLPLIPGDANFDEKVNEEDAAILAENWGEVGDWAQGNFDDDDVVGPKDAAIMAGNWYYGMSAEGFTPTGVPEPSTLVLALGLAAGLIMRRRGRE